jgi:hypothetical protein
MLQQGPQGLYSIVITIKEISTIHPNAIKKNSKNTPSCKLLLKT